MSISALKTLKVSFINKYCICNFLADERSLEMIEGHIQNFREYEDQKTGSIISPRYDCYEVKEFKKLTALNAKTVPLCQVSMFSPRPSPGAY